MKVTDLEFDWEIG